MRAAVEAQMPAVERAALHRRAAKLLVGHGAPAGRIAAHLEHSHGAGEAWAVEQMRVAARAAIAQGAPERAAALLRRAIAEPPPQILRAEILRELGSASLSTLDPDSRHDLADAMAATTDAAQRAELAGKLGIAHLYEGRPEDGVAVLEQAIDDLRGRPDLRESSLRLAASLAIVARYAAAPGDPIRTRLQDLAESVRRESAGERLVRATGLLLRPAADAESLTNAACLCQDVAAEDDWPDPNVESEVALMHLFAHEPQRAVAVADGVIAGAMATGSPSQHALGLLWRGAAAAETGDLPAAEEDLSVALEAALEPGRVPLATVAGYLTQVLVARGELERADRLLEEHGLSGPVPELVLAHPLLYGRAMLRFAQSCYDLAAADLTELGRRDEAWHGHRASPRWRSALGLVRLHMGERAEAVELARQELDLARAWGTERAMAAALRALALVQGGADAIGLLTDAVAQLEDTPWRLDRARARCDLGAALRRNGRRREGREALAIAMDEANTCAAEPLVELAADELRSSGARPRRRALSGLDSLTPSERRVADLARTGMSNREIAQALFVTIATVETHLTRVYRKLDLAGRQGLAAALDSESAG
jgi:DNA-binding CsgD family transcriptional regulator